MTPFPQPRYDRGTRGGVLIPDDAKKSYDFRRLERGVTALLNRHDKLRTENANLRRKLSEKNERIRHLDSQIIGLNQRRQDVGKRIDELISQIDQLDAQFDSQDEE